MKSGNNQKSYEEIVKKLEQVIEALENQGLDLDESVSLYEKGASLYQEAKSMLATREEKALEIIDVIEESNTQLSIDKMEEE